MAMTRAFVTLILFIAFVLMAAGAVIDGGRETPTPWAVGTER